MRKRKMTVEERRKLRLKEVKGKVDVLKGRVSVRYKEARDKAAAAKARLAEGAEGDEGDEGEDGDADASSVEDADAADSADAAAAGALGGAAGGRGEGEARWAFRRTYSGGQYARPAPGKVSDDARAVAATESEGAGQASARALIDAACEFSSAREYAQAVELLELARPRIDREQLERKLDYAAAQRLDDECLWQLAAAYQSAGRLTLAFDSYGMLRDRVLDARDRARAEKSWASVAFKLAEKLYNARRFDEALSLLRLVLETAAREMMGDRLQEEMQLYEAMTLQQLGRVDEAKEVCQNVRRKTSDKDRKAQASFVLDVMSVELSDSRNEEFHKVWEDNFRLPADSVQSTMRVGSGSALQLTPREREWRSWASKYWEDRLQSPAYYLFLTLWVTWPFAIPVVSILNKAPVGAP